MSIKGSFITWTPLHSQSLPTGDTTAATATTTTATANTTNTEIDIQQNKSKTATGPTPQNLSTTDISKSITENVSTETTATQNEFSECCDKQKKNNPLFNKKKCRSTSGYVPKLNKIKFAQCISNKLKKNNINDKELKSLLERFENLKLKSGSIDNIDDIITNIYKLKNLLNSDDNREKDSTKLDLFLSLSKIVQDNQTTTTTDDPILQEDPITQEHPITQDCCNTKGIDTKRCNNKNPVFVPNLALRKPKKEYIECLLGKLVIDNKYTNELKYLINTYILKNENKKSENEVHETKCSNFNNNEDGCNKFGMCKWEEGKCKDKIGEHSINLKEVITQLNKIINSKDDEEKFNGYCEKLINFIKFKSPYGSLGTPSKKQEATEIIKGYTEKNIWKPDYLVRIIRDDNINCGDKKKPRECKIEYNYKTTVVEETISENMIYRTRNPEYREIGKNDGTFTINNNKQLKVLKDIEDKSNTKEEYDITELQKYGYTPLIPGDVIYYPCAVSKENQKHFGIYIGKGHVVHLWSAITGGGIVVLTTLREFKPNSTGTCRGQIYVLNRQYIEKELKIYFKKRRDIVTRAVEDIGKSRYNLLSSNCQHWAMRIATGTCLSFAFRPKYNLKLIENSENVKDERLKNLFAQPPKTEPPFDDFENNPQSIQDLKKDIMKTLQQVIGNNNNNDEKNLIKILEPQEGVSEQQLKKIIHITLQKKTKTDTDTNNTNVQKKDITNIQDENKFSKCCNEQKNILFDKKKCTSTQKYVPKLNKIKFAQCISKKLNDKLIPPNDLKKLLENFVNLKTLKPGSIDNIDTIITTIYDINNLLNKKEKSNQKQNDLYQLLLLSETVATEKVTEEPVNDLQNDTNKQKNNNINEELEKCQNNCKKNNFVDTICLEKCKQFNSWIYEIDGKNYQKKNVLIGCELVEQIEKRFIKIKNYLEEDVKKMMEKNNTQTLKIIHYNIKKIVTILDNEIINNFDNFKKFKNNCIKCLYLKSFKISNNNKEVINEELVKAINDNKEQLHVLAAKSGINYKENECTNQFKAFFNDLNYIIQLFVNNKEKFVKANTNLMIIMKLAGNAITSKLNNILLYITNLLNLVFPMNLNDWLKNLNKLKNEIDDNIYDDLNINYENIKNNIQILTIEIPKTITNNIGQINIDNYQEWLDEQIKVHQTS